MRGLGSIPTGGNTFQWIILFSHSKASDANICIIAIFLHFEIEENCQNNSGLHCGISGATALSG